MCHENPGTYEKGLSLKQEVMRVEEVVMLSVKCQHCGREGRVLSI